MSITARIEPMHSIISSREGERNRPVRYIGFLDWLVGCFAYSALAVLGNWIQGKMSVCVFGISACLHLELDCAAEVFLPFFLSFFLAACTARLLRGLHVENR